MKIPFSPVLTSGFFALVAVALYPLALTPERPKAPPAPAPALQQPCTSSQDQEQLVLIIKGEDLVLADELSMLEELGELHNPAVDELLDKHTKDQIEFVRALVRLKKDYAERHPEVIGK